MNTQENVTIINVTAQRRAIAELVARYNLAFTVDEVEARMTDAAERSLYMVVTEARKEYYISTMGFRVEVEQLTETLIRVDYLIAGSVLFRRLKDNG